MVVRLLRRSIHFHGGKSECNSSGEKARRSNLLASLKECGSARDLKRANALHAAAAKDGDERNVFVASALVDVYAKCGRMVEARSVFDGVDHPDVVLWNSLMFGYADSGEGEAALKLFRRMQRTGGCEPNSRSFVAALKACTAMAAKEEAERVDGRLVKLRSLLKGKKIHSQAAASGCDAVIQVGNTLVDMYSKCGSMVDARSVFDGIKQRTVVSWNALLMGYAENGYHRRALKLFDRMGFKEFPAPNSRSFVAALKACSSLAEREDKAEALEKARDLHSRSADAGCESDTYVANSLVDSYAKCGSMDEALAVFETIRQRTVVSWTALMLGYAENGEPGVALELFHRMRREGCSADAQTYVAAVKACSLLVALEPGRLIHDAVRRSGDAQNTILANALVDFYCKCGCMIEAQQVFDAISRKDLVSWTSLIAGYSRHGNSQRVFELFKAMRDHGFDPDGVTLLCVLTACSHAGLVEEGKKYFWAMARGSYGIKPAMEHYHCMIDLLGRGNQLEQAVAMVKRMPMEANEVTWTMLLGACKKWKNAEIGRLAFDSLLRLGHECAASYAYTLMASLYGSLGMWEEQSLVESMKGKARARKQQPGQSWWTDATGRPHLFVAAAAGQG